MTRKMFTECKLVHADLSEYNILYYINDSPSSSLPSHSVDPSSPAQNDSTTQPPRGHLCIIDVSQSVEHDHPHAFDFLRSDLRNVEEFFSRRGARTIGLRRAFEFITREQLSTDNSRDAESVLREWIETPETEATDAAGQTSGGTAHEDEVFMRSYIPRTLNEVYDPERDVGVLTRGEGEKLIYKDTIGLVSPEQHADESTVEGKQDTVRKAVKFVDEDGDEEDGDDAERDRHTDDEEDGSEDETEDETNDFKEKKPRGHRHEDKDAKKVSPAVSNYLRLLTGTDPPSRNARRLPRRRHEKSASTRFQKQRRNGKSKRPLAEDRHLEKE